uniref:PDZ domain-containing protein n=2 Tax=Hemiselmis andersenii TaxID=464988 RepID=A0A6T8NPS4_HEMAN|mmetsp:Transcript_21940/g.50963  ORF Transcript_21940/g.50963 Transcript_21940/m.50963 type:complete len:449 (+) Transcript_21940:76-1422(+)
MVKTEECKWKRDKRVYTAQGVGIVLALFSLAFGIACIIFTGRANICNTYGPGGVEVGDYPAPMNLNEFQDLTAQPRNPIYECQAQCAALYTQGPQLLQQCKRCLHHCTHPWGDNIDECLNHESCDFQHYKGVQSFCKPIAFCYSKCVAKSLKVCRDDGYVAVWTGMTSLIFGLLPLIFIPIIAGFQHLCWIVAAILSFLAWLAALIISIDVFNLNMNGRGWSWLWDPIQQRNITPNYVPGMILCLLMASHLLMLFAFWDPKEVWYRNEYNVRQEEYEKKLAEEKRIKDEQERIQKEKDEREAKELAERLEREEAEEEEARLDKYLRGKATTQEVKEEAPKVEEDKPPVRVTIGLSFAYNDEQEVIVDSVTANGPAAKTGLIQRGDVVCEVGDTDPGGKPMKEVYKQPIDTWAPIVMNGAPGSSVRFILARHAEQKRFIADVVREVAPS